MPRISRLAAGGGGGVGTGVAFGCAQAVKGARVNAMSEAAKMVEKGFLRMMGFLKGALR
jgi:hypothetical protein